MLHRYNRISYIKKQILWNEYTVYIGIAIEGTEETDESWSIMKQISIQKEMLYHYKHSPM